MIDKLFAFTECNEVGTMIILYENIELICSVGKHAPGDKFDWARIDYSKGIFTLPHVANYRETIEWTYPLTLHVGQLIQEPAP